MLNLIVSMIAAGQIAYWIPQAPLEPLAVKPQVIWDGTLTFDPFKQPAHYRVVDRVGDFGISELIVEQEDQMVDSLDVSHLIWKELSGDDRYFVFSRVIRDFCKERDGQGRTGPLDPAAGRETK